MVDHPLRRQPVDLVPQQKALWDIFKRTDIQNAGCARLEELPQIVMGALSSCDSLLVVCNTKKEAAFLFESLQAANCRCFHLSAAMCVQHRRETLQALQSALDKPSAAKIESVVNGIFQKRFEDGQLNQANITLAELDKVRQSFINTLISMKHGRIAYQREPGEGDEEPAVLMGNQALPPAESK